MLSFRRVLTALPIFAAFFAGPSSQAAETYKLDPNHTQVVYSINHFGFSNPSGKFASVEGTLTLDEENPANSKVSATITIRQLYTGLAKLNEHLLGPQFFDADKYATATFASDKVEPTGKDTARVTGNLTLHGVTKPVTLEVKLNKLGDNPMTKKKTAGFSAATTLTRSDFGITQYVPNLSDEVKIGIESEASLQ